MHDILRANTCLWACGFLAFMVMTALGPAFAGPSVPLPLQKPLITDIAVPVLASDTIPVPGKKPNFGRPDVAKLLQFGQAPVPRPKPMGKPGTALSDSDALLYKKIFAYQALGAWDKADELLGLLGDFRLRGHVLYQRYMHPTAYSADFSELSGWMVSYADHPGADKIYALAVKRSPKDYNGTIRKSVKGSGINGYLDILSEHDRSYRAPRRSEADAEKVAKLEAALRKDISNGGPTAAYKKLMGDKTAKLLDPVEYDEWRAQIANSYMMTGKLDKAKELAIASARRSAEKVPLAGWVGGLVAWRQKDYRLAAPLFELTAKSPYASDWTAAAGAYWASRSHMRAGNIKDVSTWLRHAAGYPRTFYGLIATRALGWDFDFNWDIPRYDSAHRQVLDSVPAAQRAMLLVRAGQYHLAEKELKQISPDEKPAMTEALLAYADHAGLPSYAMRLAASTTTPNGNLYDAALYPESPWKPQNGYKVDRALIYALIRQESKFNPAAESRSGATGLMQLMPATASFISGRRDYRTREGQYSLTDPQLNLDIGQRYVEKLLYQDHIGTELFSLVIAYNAGPGNLRKWKQELRSMQGDPLLFVESIPMKETRAFVERVMANYWIYRLKMGQDTPSLDAVAEGHWARYVQMDEIQQASGVSNNANKHYN